MEDIIDLTSPSGVEPTWNYELPERCWRKVVMGGNERWVPCYADQAGACRYARVNGKDSYTPVN